MTVHELLIEAATLLDEYSVWDQSEPNRTEQVATTLSLLAKSQRINTEEEV